MSAEAPRRRVAVIGSGAAGVSCAMALLREGLEVTVLDGGAYLEPAQRELVEQMSGQRHENWKLENRYKLRGQTEANARGIPRKFSFGSDYPFRDRVGLVGLKQSGTELLYSLAVGGLTTMWGANVLPWRKADFDRWPFARAELEPHYRAVLEFMPLSAAPDDLVDDFPIFCDKCTRLDFSPQARELMSDLSRNREELRRVGMTFGGARLAVRVAKHGDRASGCEYCGECLYGCVYGHIYSAAETLSRLITLGARHEPDSVVTEVEETPAGVAVNCHSSDGSERRLEFERVFLAAGVIPTARLIMEAQHIIEQPVIVRDSQYFIVPFLRWKGAKEFSSQGNYSLSQIFLEMAGQKVGRYGAHLQFYSYSEIYRDVLAKMFPRLVRGAPRLVDAFLSRLFIIQGYLHSDESGTMALTLRRAAPGSRGVLELHAQPNAASSATVRALLTKLVGRAWALGGAPVLPMLDLPPAGKSYHAGGSFPMVAAPGPLETDRLGRLGGRGRIHLVDASVLPNVAATTVTFTVMANAHRIGQEAARLPASQ